MNLILRTQRAQESIEGLEPIIEWKADDYVVADGNTSVGRIYKEMIRGEMKWLWFLQTAPIAAPANNGAADTLSEAKAAFRERYEALCPRR